MGDHQWTTDTPLPLPSSLPLSLCLTTLFILSVARPPFLPSSLPPSLCLTTLFTLSVARPPFLISFLPAILPFLILPRSSPPSPFHLPLSHSLSHANPAPPFHPCTFPLVAAPCSCRLLSHQTLLWHHRLGHPSLPRLRGMHSRLLVSGLPRSLPPLPPSPAPPCLPCVEGRQRAAPHSSFPPTIAPLQTLHMDVWGPARVSGQDREHYFLLVVDDYTRYTTVFPLRTKGEVPDVLIPWIRAVRLQLREQFREDHPVLCLHSDRGGEFFSDLLRYFCRGEGILQTFPLPASPQQNGIAERRIGLVMEVARTSMIHAAAPHFLWPFAVRYAANQLNLWPHVSLPETSPTLRWTGKVGDAFVFRVWGSRAFICDTSAEKLSSHAIPCVFLGFPPDAPGWQFYHPTSRRVFPSQDVTFDESVPFYRLFPYRTAPLPPRRSSLLQVPLRKTPSSLRILLPQVCLSLRERKPGGAESEGAEPGDAESEGAESGGAEPRGTASAGGPVGASPRQSCRQEPLSLQQLREWFARRTRLKSGDAGAGGPAAGGTGAGGAGATSPRGAGVTAGAGGAGGAGDAGPGGARTRGTGAAGAGGVGGAGAGNRGAGGTGSGSSRARGTGDEDPRAGGTGAGDPKAGGAGAGGAGAGGAEAGDPRARGAGVGGTGAGDPGAGGASAGGAGAGGAGAGGTGAGGDGAGGAGTGGARVGGAGAGGTGVGGAGGGDPGAGRAGAGGAGAGGTGGGDTPDSPLPALSPYAEQIDSLAERRQSESPHASHVRVVRTGRRVPHPRPPPVPGTHIMALRPSFVPTPLSGRQPWTQRWHPANPQAPTLTQFPLSGANIVDGMWIFRVKRPPCSPPVFKAHYVARGFSQRQGVDFFQTFSPTPKMTTLRVLLHVTAQRDYELYFSYFGTAFLYGSLHEEIWMRRPPGFTGSFPGATQWSLRRPVYGLRQAPRELHDTLRTTVAALVFAPSTADPLLFLRTDTLLPPFYVLVYVDDLVFATTYTSTDLGELRSYLGLQITRNRA
ncbi:unnamed protein product [Closterium sp. NIES-54]